MGNAEPDLATRLADALIQDKINKAAAGEKKYMRSDLIRVLRSELAKEKANMKIHHKRKPYNQMSEPEFIAFLEDEPSLAGVDVKKEIGKCQFWCKCNNRICTRQTIVKWMAKADRNLVFEGAGKSSVKRPPVAPKAEHNLSVPFPGWPMILRYHVNEFTELERNELCKLDWNELTEDVRRLIVKHGNQSQ